MLGVEPPGENLPVDAYDFKSCYKLLELIPEWKKRLPEIIVTYPRWEKFIEKWDYLEQLYKGAKGQTLSLYLQYLWMEQDEKSNQPA